MESGQARMMQVLLVVSTNAGHSGLLPSASTQHSAAPRFVSASSGGFCQAAPGCHCQHQRVSLQRQLSAELWPAPLTSQSGCRRLLHTMQPTWCVSSPGSGEAPFLKSSTSRLELHSCTGGACRVTVSPQSLEPSQGLHSLHVQAGQLAPCTGDRQVLIERLLRAAASGEHKLVS